MSQYFCPNCQADLGTQKGFDPRMKIWVCRGCKAMLTNTAPWDGESEFDPYEKSVVWFCDSCEDVLNEQKGFSEDCKKWKCKRCGYVNTIDENNVFDSEEEYQQFRDDNFNETAGLSEEDLERLAKYEDLEEDLLYSITGYDYGTVDSTPGALLVRDKYTGELYMKKIMQRCDPEVIEYLANHPIKGIPKIRELFFGKYFTTLIEEHIEGPDLQLLLDVEGPFDEKLASVYTALAANVAESLHKLERPIIHRDIKPSNVKVTYNGEVYLVDIESAIFYDENRICDDANIGTHGYAAPEQFGFAPSSPKTDIYALGVMLNVMITGELPRKCKAKGLVGDIVEVCTRMDPDDRFDNIGQLRHCLLSVIKSDPDCE